jgi:hypothetical protein
MKKHALACFLLLNALTAIARDTPPNPYHSWGVCPFECCTYREWTADADVAVHAKRSEQAPVLFHLRRGESFDALTGVVVTRNPAAIKVSQAVRDGYVEGSDEPQLSLKPGDVVYMLTPLGEGAYLFWYKGKVYRAGSIEMQGNPGIEWKGMSLTWWKQVRNKAGKTGWTRSDRFTNADACG